MKIEKKTELSSVKAHLKNVGNAVSGWDKYSEILCYRVWLEESDIPRIIFWFEHKIHTDNGSRRLRDILHSAGSNPRIKRFIQGDDSRDFSPIDLRDTEGLEPVLVGEDFNLGNLLVIDGNHRIIAQQLMGHGMVDVPLYVCVSPSIRRWPYYPDD